MRVLEQNLARRSYVGRLPGGGESLLPTHERDEALPRVRDDRRRRVGTHQFPEVSIHMLSADPMEQGAFKYPNKRTHETLIFWGSVELAQMCSAFVGYFGSGSAVSTLAYEFM